MEEILGLAVLASVLVLLFRQWGNGVLSTVIAVIAVTVAAGSMLLRVRAVFEGINAYLSLGISRYIPFFGKVLGVAWLAQISSDLCKEMGNATLAGYVEMIGRAEILLLSLPILEEVLRWTSESLS